MRIGRIILAGLAPLVSLSALAAHIAANPQTQERQVASPDVLSHFLHAASPFIAPADTASATPADPSPQAVFALEALTPTPLGGALCLVASAAALLLHKRRHLRIFLRC
jgi:hypothetical protein